MSIDDAAHAHVVLDATLRIDGGWLEALELDGLDRGLVLDPLDPVTMSPAPIVDAFGEATSTPDALVPTVTLREDGVLVLAFTRRHAPRRGDYVVHLAYDADLASHAARASDGGHVVWTFPAWRHGLDSVRVELRLPAGARPVQVADEEIEVERGVDADGSFWTLTRAHLARTREWPIDVAMSETALANVPPVEAEVRAPIAVVPTLPRPPWQGGVALAIASMFVALRASRTRARERDDGVRERALVPLPPLVRALLALVIGALLMGIAIVGVEARVLMLLATALVAVGVSRGPAEVIAPSIGSFRRATISVRRAARRTRLRRAFATDAWLDATTLPGGALLVAAATALGRVPSAALGPSLVALAVVFAVALDAPRASRSVPPLVALCRLLDFAARVRVSLEGPAIALAPVVHLDVKGVAQEARLRVLCALPDGALRADVVIARTGLFGSRHALLVVVARGSLADRACASESALSVVVVGRERAAYLTPVDPSRLGVAIERIARAAEALVVEPARKLEAAA